MIRCSIQELILADKLAGCNITANFTSMFSNEEIKEALIIGNEKIRERKWFENNKYSNEFINITKYLKLSSITKKEIVLNNLVYRYRNESEEGILIGVLENDEVEIGVVSKGEFFIAIAQNYSVMIDNVDEISNEKYVSDMLGAALLEIKPQMSLSYSVNKELEYSGIIREFEDKIIEENLVSKKLKTVNSKYLRSKIISFLEVGYE